MSARPFPTLKIIISRCGSVLVTCNCTYAVKIVHHSLRVCVIPVSAWTSVSYPRIWTLQSRLWHHAWCHITIACCFDELSRVSLREQWGISRDTQWHACMDSIYLVFSCWCWPASVLAWNYLYILDLLWLATRHGWISCCHILMIERNIAVAYLLR